MIDIPIAPEALITPDVLKDRASMERFLIECQEVFFRCIDEYFDPEFQTRAHGSHKTYQSGCRGPFCMAAMRRQSRNTNGHAASDKYATHDTLVAHYLDHLVFEEQQFKSVFKRALVEGMESAGERVKLPQN